MKKCECWHKTADGYNYDYGVCYGTKECDPCECGGDESRCDFYPKKREAANRTKNNRTPREEIERLLNQTGRTMEELSKSYSVASIVATGRSRGATPYELGEIILHQSDVIELLVAALRDALDKPRQKPLTLTEANSYQDPMWIEFKVFKEASGWRDGLCDALNWAHRVYRDLNREAEFMVHYRLWRHRPTDEERSAAAWES